MKAEFHSEHREMMRWNYEVQELGWFFRAVAYQAFLRVDT